MAKAYVRAVTCYLKIEVFGNSAEEAEGLIRERFSNRILEEPYFEGKGFKSIMYGDIEIETIPDLLLKKGSK